MPNLRSQFADRDVEQALIALKKGTNVLKHGRHGRPKTCFCWLSNDAMAVCYQSDKQTSIPLANVTKVVRGQKTAVFRRYLQVDKECQSISLIYNRGERTLDFVCQRTEEADIWYIGLQSLLGRPSQERVETEELLGKYVPSRSPKDLSPGLPYMSPVRSPYENENVNDLFENVGEAPSIPAVPTYIFGNGNSSEMSQVDTRDAEWESVSTAESLRGSVGGGSQAESSERGGPGSWGGEKPTQSPDTLLSGPFTRPIGLPLSSELTAQEVEALGDVFMWGEGLGGGAWGMQASVNGTRGDALIPLRLEACAVLDVTAMACGSRHAALVTRQGEVFCWGEEKGGRLGQGVDGDVQRPHLVEALAAKAEIVACGDFHTCVVTREGELYSWGDGTHLTGAVGHGPNFSPWLPKPVTLFNQHVVQVACGPYHTAVVLETGQLFTFGDGTFGALGHGDRRSTKVPVEVEALRDHCTLQVSCGVWHTAAVVDVRGSGPSVHEGSVFTWGDGDKGCLGHGDTTERLGPVLVKTFQDFPCTQVACGTSFTAVLTAIGQVFTMGSSSYGQLGRTSTDGRVPGLVEGELQGKQVEQIACGAQHLAALVSGAEVYSWGRGANGRLGHGDVKDRHFPTCVDALRGRRVLQVACGGTFTAAICAHKQTSSLENRACSQCRQTFGLRRVRHGCYHCGRSVCHSCSSHRALGAAMAPSSLRPSRVCDRCYGNLCQGPVPTLQSMRSSNSSFKGGWNRQRSSESNLSDSADLSRKGGGEANNSGPSGKLSLSRPQSFVRSSPKWGNVSFPRSFSESILLGSNTSGTPKSGFDPTLGDKGEKVVVAQFGNLTVNLPRKGKSVTGSPIRRSASPSRRGTSPMGGSSAAPPFPSSGLTQQELEVLTLRRSNETMGHEVNRLRVLVDEWREQFGSMEREAEIEKSQREAQAAEVEAGNELLAALSAQLASAARVLPPGSVRYGKLAMKGGSGSVIYSGPLLVGEILPPSLIELPEDTTEDEGLPLLIRSNSPVKRSSSSQDFSVSLSRGFSITNLWHSASRSSRDRHPSLSLNEPNGRSISDNGEVVGGGGRESILRNHRRPFPSADGGNKVAYQQSFNNGKNNTSVEGVEVSGFGSQSRNSEGRLHDFPSEKGSRQSRDGYGGSEHSSGPILTASETGRKGIPVAPTFSKWGANLCSDPMGGEDSSESGTPPASESDRPFLPSGEFRPDFFPSNRPPLTANEGEPSSTSHPFLPSLGFPLGNSTQSQGGASQSNSKPVDSEEEGAVPRKGPEDGGKKERVEHPAEGVFITLIAHSTEGYNELRRVQFSGKLFNEKQAETWWTENKVRIREQYKIRSNRARNTEVLLKRSGELGKHRA